MTVTVPNPSATTTTWTINPPTTTTTTPAPDALAAGPVSTTVYGETATEPGELTADDEVRVVLAFGLLHDVDPTPIWASWPIWIAVATAVVLALIVPTRYRRRRRQTEQIV